MTNRVVDIIVGLAAGSEAKGKLIESIAHQYDGALVRTGSVNAAHTVYYNGEKVAWHQLPAGSLHAPKDALLILGAGAQIDLDYFTREIEILRKHDALKNSSGRVRVMVDPNATIIDPIDKFAENGYEEICGPQWFNPTTCEFHNGGEDPHGATKAKGTCEGCSLYPKGSLHRSLGSTTHGSGMNLCRKIARGSTLLRDAKGDHLPPVRYAKDAPELQPYLNDTVAIINALIDDERSILLEGTQGASLSLHHGYVPFTTARDTNAAAWMSEAGVSPMAIRDVYGVVQTYPIRVAGNSGPMGGDELTWEEVTKRAGLPYEHNDDPSKVVGLIQYTTATKRVRRIFEFDHAGFERALQINRPTQLMLSFVDYLNHEDFGVSAWDSLSQKSRDAIVELEERHGVYFRWVSTGPLSNHVIDREEDPAVSETKRIFTSGTHGLSRKEQEQLIDAAQDAVERHWHDANGIDDPEIIHTALDFVDGGKDLTDKLVLILKNIVKSRAYSVTVMDVAGRVLDSRNQKLAAMTQYMKKFGALTHEQVRALREEIVIWATHHQHDELGLLKSEELNNTARLPAGWARR